MNSSLTDYMPRLSVRLAGAALILMQAGAAVIPAHASDPAFPQPVRFTLTADRLASGAGEQEQELEQDWEPFVSGARAQAGSVIRYTLHIENCGTHPISSIVVTQPIPTGTVYLLSTARSSGPTTCVSYLVGHGVQQYSERPVITKISSAVYTAELLPLAAELLQQKSLDAAPGEPAPAESYRQVRWTFTQALQPKAVAQLSYQVRVQ